LTKLLVFLSSVGALGVLVISPVRLRSFAALASRSRNLEGLRTGPSKDRPLWVVETEEERDLDCQLGQSLDKQDPILAGEMNDTMEELRIVTRKNGGRRTTRRYLQQTE